MMKRERKIAAIISGILFIVGKSYLYAQGCCTPGTSSLYGAERGIAQYRTLNASLSYQYNFANRAYQGSQQVDDLLRRTAFVQSLNIELEYGIADRVSLLMLGSYVWKSREFTTSSAVGSGSQTTTFHTNGVGDVTLLGKYALVQPTISSPYEVSVGLGAKLPTGSYTQELEGARYPIDLQPGTGGADLLGWVFLARSYPAQQLSFYGSFLYRYGGSNPDGYKIGNEWVASLGAEYSINEWFQLSLQLRGRGAGEDFSSGRFLPSTGGQMYAVLPGIIYREGIVAVGIYSLLPFYRNLSGTQVSLNYLIGIGTRCFFDFRGSPEPQVESENPE
jgi:hypothetical protein